MEGARLQKRDCRIYISSGLICTVLREAGQLFGSVGRSSGVMMTLFACE